MMATTRLWFGLIYALAFVCASGMGAADVELRVNAATLIRNGEPSKFTTVKDRFGTGLDGVTLTGAPVFRTQLQFPCGQVPEGDYYLGLLTMMELWHGYLGFGEHLGIWVQLYVNDTRVLWTSHTEPQKPENAAEKSFYQAELRCDRPVRVKPGDVVRVVHGLDGGSLIIGPLRLYRTAPAGGVVKLGAPNWGRPSADWLAAKWEDTQREGDTIRQPCLLYNPGVLPRTATLEVEARDYLQRVLLSRREEVTIPPGQKMTKVFEFKTGASGRVRLTLTATAKAASPEVRLVKFYLNDVTDGPRRTLGLNGEWEMCFAPGAEPGNAPPADAKWTKVNVPSLQKNDQAHCAWYRRAFDAPAYLTGERVVLRCGLLLSEGWFYLNGQRVGHVRHGTTPFEVDVTSGFKPGQRNELRVAVRDWIAYSPKNQQRIQRGEAPIFKVDMVDVAGYSGASYLGMGGNVGLETRPVVSVDDVFVVTSVRQKRLTLRYRLLNTGKAEQTVRLSPSILDAGDVVKTLPPTEVRVPAGQTASVTLESAWPEAKLWWPESPKLYDLRSQISDLRPQISGFRGQINDQLDTRFGFREFWVEGISYYLNGVRMKVRSAWATGASGMSAAWPHWQPERRYEAIWAWQTKCQRDWDHQLTRTHNIAGVEDACEVADETGLMLKIEEGDVAQVNFTFDQTYWNNALKRELAVVDAYKNHPSVVIWSAGNENMWGWIYQGEAAKTLGNRWQIKIAQAMREFDLQRRPIEWESDGDLMGGWEYHALHYPRELSYFSDVPNGAWWGPLDGKTVVPYSMGPITLGQKALTVGEAFWPATLAHPYGETIVIGDDAYLGGPYWSRAWLEASQFFVAGFRDVEFALIDTYTPLSMIKPQTVVLKQETRSFMGGQTVKREANVHNDVPRAADLRLTWALEAGKPLAKGEAKMRLGPAELKRLTLDIPLPAVSQPTEATLRLDLSEGDQLVHTESRHWQIHPPVAVRPSSQLKLAVFDPLGQTAAMLTKLKVPFTLSKDMAMGDERALIIGRDALKQPPEGPWREALTGFVRDGGKALILEQSESPDFLPTPLTQAKRKTTIAFARAPDHPALKGLTDADLRWWADDHYVSVGNYRKPIRGNCLPLVDVGTMDGLVEAALLEEYEGKGSFLLCQMLLTDKAAVAPPAGRLLQNLLDYLASPGCFRTLGATAVLAKTDSPLRKALDDSRLIYADLTGKVGDLTPEKFKAAIVDATALEASAVEALKGFASKGGRVLIHRPTPTQQPLLESLLGIRLRFFPVDKEPMDIQYHALRRSGEGLMAGISNHELFWASQACLKEIRHEGCWWSHYKCPPEEMIADYFVSPGDGDLEKAVRLTRPGVLLQVPSGAGGFVLSQLRLDQPVSDCAVTVSRLRSLLLTNLGCALQSEGGAAQARAKRLSQCEFFTVNLSPYVNRGLRDDKTTGLVGWTNQGENDMRALPTGRQTFAGIPFFIATPKSAIVLHSVQANNQDLPKEVTGIQVGRSADMLFFLHTAGWCQGNPFRYRVHYEDGSSLDIPIVAGQHVMDWWQEPSRFAEAMARHGLFVAWQGDNPMRKGVVLPGYEWVNPHPEKPIRAIDFLTVPESRYTPVPVLAAITCAVSRPREGVVTDVIGTEGLKVKLGTQEQEVFYIGCAGVPKEHPFHAKAVEAHKALVLGQKVTLVDDVVTQSSSGRRLSYVYLGSDVYNINNQVNAKLIGDGLAKLGQFEGNNRHRMYLENLGFIAQQRKAGLWAEAAR